MYFTEKSAVESTNLDLLLLRQALLQLHLLLLLLIQSLVDKAVIRHYFYIILPYPIRYKTRLLGFLPSEKSYTTKIEGETF